MTENHEAFKDYDRDFAMRNQLAHIRRVQSLMSEMASVLQVRLIRHDQSKWSEQEWPHFAGNTSKLSRLTYGTPEYQASLEAIKPALDHHYQHNSHHPEHHEHGVQDMTLFDLLEMLADWKASGERHKDGCLERSLDVSQTRFGISNELMNVIRLTAKELGWL